MANTANPEYVQVAGGAFLVAVRWLNIVTGADFVRDDIYSITETVTDTTTDTATTRTLDKADVVFDTLQTSSLIRGGDYSHNVRVAVPATKIALAGRKYKYQLTIVPDDGSGGADTDHTQKTNEIDVIGD